MVLLAAASALAEPPDIVRTERLVVRAAGYDYCLVSENIGFMQDSRGFQTAQLATGLVDGWKRSPGHRKNMLEPIAIDTGVAVARGNSGRYYGVQMFGRPKAAHVEFRVRNATPDAVSYRVGERTFTLRPRELRTHWSCAPEDLSVASGGLPGSSEAAFTPLRGERYEIVRGGAAVFLRPE